MPAISKVKVVIVNNGPGTSDVSEETVQLAGLLDCPAEVLDDTLARFTGPALGRLRCISSLAGNLATEETKKRIHAVINPFFPPSTPDNDGFWKVFAETGSAVWGRSALGVGFPAMGDSSKSLLLVCPFTSIRQWAVLLVNLGWTPISLRRGDAFSVSVPSTTDYVANTLNDVVLTPTETAPDNSARSDHGVLILEKDGLLIDLHIAASDCILPVLLTSDYTSDLIFFDRSCLCIFHPFLFDRGLAMRRVPSDGIGVSSIPNFGFKFEVVTSLARKGMPCKNECTAIEHHLNKYTPPDVFWSFRWNSDVQDVSPPYKARGWAWRIGEEGCSNVQHHCPYAVPDVDIDVTEYITSYIGEV